MSAVNTESGTYHRARRPQRPARAKWTLGLASEVPRVELAGLEPATSWVRCGEVSESIRPGNWLYLAVRGPEARRTPERGYLWITGDWLGFGHQNRPVPNGSRTSSELAPPARRGSRSFRTAAAASKWGMTLVPQPCLRRQSISGPWMAKRSAPDRLSVDRAESGADTSEARN